MFKLVVLSALFALAAARPGGLIGAHVAYSAPVVAAPVAVPAAVSHQYRSDVISTPVVAAYAAPAVVAAPVVQKVVAPVATYSAAVTHQSRVDLHHPIAAPVAYAAPAVHAW